MPPRHGKDPKAELTITILILILILISLLIIVIMISTIMMMMMIIIIIFTILIVVEPPSLRNPQPEARNPREPSTPDRLQPVRCFPGAKQLPCGVRGPS